MSRLKITIFVALSYFLIVSNVMAIREQEPAPNFVLTSPEGVSISLAQFSGKIVYLDFWASWCGPCRHSLPWMSKLQDKFGAAGLQVIAINLDANRRDADKLLSGIEHHFSVLYDPVGETASKFAPSTMPSSYLIGRDGKVLLIHPGFHEGDGALLESEITKILSENP